VFKNLKLNYKTSTEHINMRKPGSKSYNHQLSNAPQVLPSSHVKLIASYFLREGNFDLDFIPNDHQH